MRAISPADIVVELEDAIAACPPERCLFILKQTTSLLLASQDRLKERQVSLLDDILLHLMERIASDALVPLSVSLAELKIGPKKMLRRLAAHEDPAVAAPVLRNSPVLAQEDLEAIASARGEQHLLAIAGRRKIEKALADILVKRGGKKVCLAIAKNQGAQLSDAAYAILVARAEHDGELTKELALRPNVPDMVVRRLLAAASPEAAATVQSAATSVETGGSAKAVGRPCAAEYEDARPQIVALNRIGKLNDSAVNRFAIRGEIANLLTALSVLSGAPIDVIETVVADEDCEGLVMACRASRLNWQTTLAILSNRGARLSFNERERAQQLFETLHLSTSQWAVRWGEMAAGAGAASKDSKVARSGDGR
ncbi:DUF2336 domain-containing protein [Bradyrhizobium manausense]|uniref:DUF2336 domain-containing protein n=1 Tax=Bradyrhizobium TaxID=374 RepID=UPI001BACEAB4|nr:MULTISPECIES: DUF2336 domain-containing protein [Bradyrhizobium]MBR0828098.1 DUF2336 domain-containing protein [Bradyrhizobium manausense]UVO32955.1 DUF2336 domain-containing protein [Bradyrhizobium arachidis]